MQTLGRRILPISCLEKAQLRMQLSRVRISSTCNAGKYAEDSEGSAYFIFQQHGTDTDPAAAPTPGAQSLCAVGTQMVREREAKGPAQSPDTKDGGGKWTNQAFCPLHSCTISTGTKTFLNKRQADTREEKSQSFQILGAKWGRQTKLFEMFRSVWKTMQCRLPAWTI